MPVSSLSSQLLHGAAVQTWACFKRILRRTMTVGRSLKAGAIGLALTVLMALPCVLAIYDETVWTRQWQSFREPFPAHLVLPTAENIEGFQLNSRTGPYDLSAYDVAATTEAARSVTLIMDRMQFAHGFCSQILAHTKTATLHLKHLQSTIFRLSIT